MVAGFREFLDSKAGKTVAIVVVVLGLLGLFLSFRANFGDSASAISRDRLFICAKTGKTFEHTIQVGEKLPVHSPHSGERTGYPPELCFWTKDGKVKTEPTYVLLNEHKGTQGPTFCPDCGRLVLPNNATPLPGDRPPPTADQYKTMRSPE